MSAQARPPVPSVRTGTPATGSYGASIAITGIYFTGATAVNFGGAPAQSFTVVNDGQINAVVGCGTSGSITVTTPSGTGTSAIAFTYTPLAPVVTSFTPSSGVAGAVITVQGRLLECATSVSIGGAQAMFTVNRDGSLAVTVPSGAQSGLVAVTTAGGTSMSSSSFTAVPAPPTIPSFSPTSGMANGAIIIQGDNLSGATRVTIGGVGASFTVNRDGTLNVTIPSGAQSGVITVTTPGGTATSRTTFTVVTPAPTITSFSPTSGNPNIVIIIQGTNFTGASRVTIGGVNATFAVNNDGSMSVTVPSGAPSGVITVTTPGGTVSSVQGFRVIPTGVHDAALSRFQARLFPQPASTETTLQYTLSDVSDVRVELANILGTIVRTFSPPGKQSSGAHELLLPIQEMSAGAYFARLSAQGMTVVLPLQIVR